MELKYLVHECMKFVVTLQMLLTNEGSETIPEAIRAANLIQKMNPFQKYPISQLDGNMIERDVTYSDDCKGPRAVYI